MLVEFAPVLLFVAHAATAAPPASVVERIDGVAITVADLDRSVAFFTDVLDFRLLGREERAGDDVEHVEGVFGARLAVARLALGDERIELVQFTAAPGRPLPADARGNDRIFQHIAIVVRDMREAFDRVHASGVTQASNEPQTLPVWNQKAGGIEAFYFRDPDLHWLELIRFPAGKGDPRWQTANGGVFLGIDHTAIVVDDTERALGFWRDELGLEIVGGSENYGVEQEHLNGVFGARLRITTLHAKRGIGVELLDYLSPCDGRPAPADLRANDVAHWWTLGAGDPDRVDESTRRGVPRWVSPGVVGSGERAAISLRDPDGHGVLVQRVPNEQGN